MAQAGTAHKGPEQSDVAIVRGIAAPGEKGIGPRGKRGNQQQAPRVAMRKSDEQGNKDGHAGRHNYDTTPLRKEAAPR